MDFLEAAQTPAPWEQKIRQMIANRGQANMSSPPPDDLAGLGNPYYEQRSMEALNQMEGRNPNTSMGDFAGLESIGQYANLPPPESVQGMQNQASLSRALGSIRNSQPQQMQARSPEPQRPIQQVNPKHAQAMSFAKALGFGQQISTPGNAELAYQAMTAMLRKVPLPILLSPQRKAQTQAEFQLLLEHMSQPMNSSSRPPVQPS